MYSTHVVLFCVLTIYDSKPCLEVELHACQFSLVNNCHFCQLLCLSIITRKLDVNYNVCQLILVNW